MNKAFWIPAALPLLALCAAAVPATGPATRPTTRPEDVPLGPDGPMFGSGGQARTIVFVCDATGSMRNKSAAVRDQLVQAIKQLKPIQSFNVIFYCDGPTARAVDPEALLPATDENKRKVFAFMEDVANSGQNDPIPALRLAFKQNPQLVYLLSDGGLDDNLRTNKEVIDEISRLNPTRRAKVNTIMFDTYSDSGEHALQRIAKDNGGAYRYVDESKLPW